MKKRTRLSIAVIAAGALTLSAALPASAAVAYKATAAPTIGALPAVDASTNTIYSTGSYLDSDQNEHFTLSAVDGRTLKTKTTVEIGYLMYDTTAVFGVIDLRVNSKAHTVWISGAIGRGAGFVYEFNGSTLAKLHDFTTSKDALPGTLAINPANDTGYVAYADQWYGDTAPFLASMNGVTGVTKTVLLPAPAQDGMPYLYNPGNVAFDSANNGVYVTFNGSEYAYASGTLKLASAVSFPKTETNPSPQITADGTTHTLYAVGDSSIYKITGSTNKIASTIKSGYTTTKAPVIDPSIKTLYVGTRVLSETTLAQTGTLPKAATSVNGTTHSIYSPGYVTTRTAS